LGIGWFPSSATPGMAGNFAVVGHRTEGRAPFLYIENLVVGDEIVVQTRDAWLVYRLIRQEIVTPQSTWVLDPIPSPVSRENAAVSPHLITLMTCTPRGTTRQRWVWWGILSEVGRAGTPPHAVESPKQLERGHIDNKLRARRLLSECNGIARCRPFV
jgi:sortase A